jgi:hypothetical protein
MESAKRPKLVLGGLNTAVALHQLAWARLGVEFARVAALVDTAADQTLREQAPALLLELQKALLQVEATRSGAQSALADVVKAIDALRESLPPAPEPRQRH